MVEDAHTKISVDEMTTEQRHRKDADYVAAVNKGLKQAQDQLADGKTVPATQVWKKLGLDR